MLTRRVPRMVSLCLEHRLILEEDGEEEDEREEEEDEDEGDEEK